MKQAKITTVGSIIAAIVASLCCIGPVVVALIGVGSIGAFTVFESSRPYLIGLTAILLGLAFYWTYRKREVRCEDGSCRIESAGKWNKVAVWLGTLLAAVAIAFPYFNIASTQPVNNSVLPVTHVELRIDGMDCRACAKGVEAMVAGINGVHKALVDYEQGKAVVEYDPAIVQSYAFIDQINESGFSAEILKEKKGN